MTTLPKINSLDSEFEVNGTTVKMVYKFDSNDDGEGGWINGLATVNGRTINVGGGWVSDSGSISDYEGGDLGDLDDLVEAVGLDSEDDDDIETVTDALHADCPGSWPHEDYETLAEDEGEFRTRKVVRIGGDLYVIDENGGSRGGYRNGSNEVEAVDEREAKRVMLEMGCDLKAVAKAFR